MNMMLTVICGFVTNSSSVVTGFNKSVLDNPAVKEVLARHKVEAGFLPEEPFMRSMCGAVLLDDEAIEQFNEQVRENEYANSLGSLKPGDVYVVYGDEYDSLAKEICYVMSAVHGAETRSFEYN